MVQHLKKKVNPKGLMWRKPRKKKKKVVKSHFLVHGLCPTAKPLGVGDVNGKVLSATRLAYKNKCCVKP